MNKKSILQFVVLGVLISAFASGWPQRLLRGPATADVKTIDQRPRMPEFSLPVIGAQEMWRLSDHRGQVVLVNFWATWCPPCRTETPELVKLHRELSGRGFTVVGISLDEDPDEQVPIFVKHFDVPYPMVRPTASFPMAREVESLPTTLLIDREGKVARSWVGGVHADDLRPSIEVLLAEGK